MTTEKKTDSSKQSKTPADDLTTTRKKGEAELIEEELKRVDGGSLGKGEQKRW